MVKHFPKILASEEKATTTITNTNNTTTAPTVCFALFSCRGYLTARLYGLFYTGCYTSVYCGCSVPSAWTIRSGIKHSYHRQKIPLVCCIRDFSFFFFLLFFRRRKCSQRSRTEHWSTGPQRSALSLKLNTQKAFYSSGTGLAFLGQQRKKERREEKRRSRSYWLYWSTKICTAVGKKVRWKVVCEFVAGFITLAVYLRGTISRVSVHEEAPKRSSLACRLWQLS